MKKIALLSDIHSNLIALEAVLKDVGKSGATEAVFLGDIVGYGSHPAECVEWVRKLGGKCVMGNHDAAMPECRKPGFRFSDPDWQKYDLEAGLMHSAKALNEEDASWLGGLPYWLEMPGAVVAHASLDYPQMFNYIEDEESAAPTLDLLGRHRLKVGFFGHTHEQKVFPAAADGVEWLNEETFRIREDMPCAVMVGSVGQNRKEDDRRACWTLWDPETRAVEFRKVEYDRQKAAQLVIEAGLPMEGALRLLAVGESLKGN